MVREEFFDESIMVWTAGKRQPIIAEFGKNLKG